MTIYSLDVLLFLFGTSLLFHVQFICCFLTCIQISQEAGEVVWYSHPCKKFPQLFVIHTVKIFGIVNSRNRCFPGTLLLFRWSSRYWQSTSCKMPGWMKHKLESRLLGEISITLDKQMTHPYGRKWRRTKEPLDESNRGEWKSWLKTQHSKN